MKELLKQVYFENSLQQWLTALLLMVGSAVLITIFRRIVVSKLRRWAERTTTTLDDFLLRVIDRTVIPLLYVVALYFSLNSLQMSAPVRKMLHIGFLVATTFFVIQIITALIRQFIFSFIKTRDNGEAKEKQARGLLIIINIAIWSLGFVFLIDNLGYDITALIAGLGIGGIAIALAAQTILGDLFSYFVIFFDRPFEIGDFIIVEDNMGTVEYVGVKTTRIRTLSGEQLICSNTYLTNARIHNYKRMEQRRVVFNLGVTYQTRHEQLKQIPQMVRQIIEARELVRFDRGHFSAFGNFSLDFEFVYYVLSADYNKYMDIQQQIYLNIAERFEQEGIEFAYPTQTLFVNAQQQAEDRINEKQN